MGRVLALGGGAVVTTGASTADLAVVKGASTGPARWIVTSGTIIVTGNMICRFTLGPAAVMAALTATLYLTMIDS